MEENKKDTWIRVKNTPPFKLKDKPHRIFKVINLKQQFGFVPEIIIVEKVRGSNNAIFLRAILTPDEIIKQDKEIAEREKQQKKDTLKVEKKEHGNTNNKSATA